jgi:L-lactate dehydrogenase complex protein LldG
MVANALMDARSAMLGDIRRALTDVPRAEDPAIVWEQPSPSTVDLDGFVKRLIDYGASVARAASDAEVAAAVTRLCTTHRAERILLPGDFPESWEPTGIELVADQPTLSHQAIGEVDGVLTAAALGIADTGTIVLDGGPGQGRRAVSLLPDLHICVVRTRDILGTVPEAVSALAQTSRPVTFISGPSATSDIELSRVEGVHGPRRLAVVLSAR